MAKKKIKELSPKELKHACDPKIFKFKSTEEVSDKETTINQKRALKAIDFGLNIKSGGFNLYVSGITGTGRNTTILKEVEKIAKNEPPPEDICYLYNFEKNDEPKVLKLPAGVGQQFHTDMDEHINELEVEIQKAFTSEDYEKNKKEVEKSIKKEQNKFSSELEKYAESKSFIIKQTLTDLVVLAVKDKKPLKEKDFEKLSSGKKKQIEKNRHEIYEKIYEFSRKIKDSQKQTRKEMEKLDKKVAVYAIGHLMDDMKKKYKDYDLIVKHLESVLKDILENLDYFKKDETADQIPFLNLRDSKQDILYKYKVNVMVDHSASKGAPVIVEDNPIYHNLIGKIEHRAQFGILTTDFTMIKPGSVHRANGGYLILQAMDLLKDYFAWEALKRIIKNRKVKIESLYEKYGLIQTTTLKPEPVSVDLKVIIVGNPLLYHLLYIYDEDLRKLFKVKVDFDSTMEKSRDTIQKYGLFVANKCRKENLLPFKNDAVAKIVDYSCRLSQHKNKLTARFINVVDIMREAHYWASKEKAKLVEGKHVKKALNEKIYRSNMVEKKIQELIKEETLFIDTKGKEIGQINGLSILDMGDYVFGKPSRITVRTFVGKGEVINIEREAELSGSIHSKGVLILSGYLGDKFGQDKPLAFSASICFEQLYDEVDGDSASSAELFCLLSSLAEIGLKQDIAVTGSINQKGKIQPIGGVNQKIEGFYDICKIRRLTGTQGVIIPESNVKHLMLKDEVVDAVKDGKFHVYSIKTVEEGLEILTGVKAGNRRKDGSFPKDTVNYLVDKKLREYAALSMEFFRRKKK